MPAIIAVIAGLIVGTLIGIGVGYALRRRSAQHSLQQAEEDARQILTEAETRSRELELETKEEALKLRNEAEADIREWRSELSRTENRLSQREENLDRKAAGVDSRDAALHERSEALRSSEDKIAELRAEQERAIERASGLSRDEAREQLLAAVDDEIREEGSRRVREMEREVEATAGVRARKIIATAIQRFAGEVTAETTVSVVPIGSDDMKGAHHRARGAQHPRHRSGHRRRPDHRRHARRRDHQLVRPGTARGRARRPGGPPPGRTHPPHSHRGSGRKGPAQRRDDDGGVG